MKVREFLIVVAAFLLGAMRITGHKVGIQAAAHLLVGGLFAVWWLKKSRGETDRAFYFYTWVLLSIVELSCFIVDKLFHVFD